MDWDWDEDWWRAILIIIGVIIGIFLIISSFAYTNNYKHYYKYVDINGNNGIASSCYETDGGLICRLNDDTKIQVASYKYIIEKK